MRTSCDLWLCNTFFTSSSFLLWSSPLWSLARSFILLIVMGLRPRGLDILVSWFSFRISRKGRVSCLLMFPLDSCFLSHRLHSVRCWRVPQMLSPRHLQSPINMTLRLSMFMSSASHHLIVTIFTSLLPSGTQWTRAFHSTFGSHQRFGHCHLWQRKRHMCRFLVTLVAEKEMLNRFQPLVCI